MIETIQDLKDWFILHKVPKQINELAFEAWNEALECPSLPKIWKYYVLAGMDAVIRDQFSWSSIQLSLGETQS
jgi:hypothetical protein